MNQQARDAVAGMLNCFPQTNQDYGVFLRTLDSLCNGVTDRAVIEAAERFARGDVGDQSKKFAPSGPEFVAEARRRQELTDSLSRPRLPAPVYRRSAQQPWELQQARKRAEYAHRDVLHTDVSNERFRSLSAASELPVGAVWVACLGTIYGPEPKRMAAE